MQSSCRRTNLLGKPRVCFCDAVLSFLPSAVSIRSICIQSIEFSSGVFPVWLANLCAWCSYRSSKPGSWFSLSLLKLWVARIGLTPACKKLEPKYSLASLTVSYESHSRSYDPISPRYAFYFSPIIFVVTNSVSPRTKLRKGWEHSAFSDYNLIR